MKFKVTLAPITVEFEENIFTKERLFEAAVAEAVKTLVQTPYSDIASGAKVQKEVTSYIEVRREQ